MEIIDVAHGELYMLGAVLTWYGLTWFGNFWLGAIVATLIIGILGIGLEFLTVKPLETRSLGAYMKSLASSSLSPFST